MSAQEVHSFFSSIGREDLEKVITEKNPWAYFSLEVYDTDQIGLKGGGGLGILAADTAFLAKSLGIPMSMVTLFYPNVCKRKLSHFVQEEYCVIDHPSNVGFEKIDKPLSIRANNDDVPLEIYQKDSVIALYEHGLRELYSGSHDSEHRLFQEVVLGFGGYKALKVLGIEPSIYHLNEAGTVFAAVAFLDDLCKKGIKFEDALNQVREKTVFTNHTLIPAATASFRKDYYERYVFKNIESKEVIAWLTSLVAAVRGGLRISTIALEIAGKNNGVSKLHAKIASKNFKRVNGQPIDFVSVTNGIFLDRWVHPELLHLYKRVHYLDDHDLPNASVPEVLDRISSFELRRAKHRGKEDLYKYLETRQNQYGEPIRIPYHDQVAIWARRFAGYKRPHMLFENQKKLLDLLEGHKFHLLIAGTAHPSDHGMMQEMNRLLHLVDQNHDLKKRVHFIQNYDDELGKYFAQGAHIFINTPKVGYEACGTSWMKAMANCAMVISTNDGGIADNEEKNYLQITGQNYPQEVFSTYRQFEKALEIINSDEKWRDFVLEQLKTYFPIVSGSRMMKDYLNFIFPQAT